MRVFLAPVLLLLLCYPAGAQISTGPARDPRERPGGSDAATFKVDVKLVNVFATVLDAHGAPVASLKKNDFDLYEDGVRQNIAVFDRESELPLSIVLAIDTSLSTRKDLKLELESARRFAHSILRRQDGLALYQFSEEVDEVVPFSANLRQIDRGIDRIHEGSATALYDAIYLGSRALYTRQGRKVLVVITDGGDTASKLGYQSAVRAAQESEALVYSIIVVPVAASAGRELGGEHALIQISADTGGKHFYAENVRQLDEAFRRIGEELRIQYLLAYYPSRRLSDSEFRRIEVRVHAAGSEGAGEFTVRHRSGYYTAKAQ